jgi:ATP-dependent RNA helicase RhlE
MIELNTEITAEPMGFAELGITGQLLRAANMAGFVEPKPIQAKTIPAQLQGRDLLGIAQTGSGKTAAFALPILSKILALGNKRRPKTARALILAPTRELAVQIEETIRKLSKGAHISTALVLGGVSRHSQVKKILPGVDVLVATPGRLTDLVRERDVVLADTTWLILDEADRMLDMGFINDVRRIAKATHPARQTALFSATMPDEIAELARDLLRDPLRIDVAPQGTTAAEIHQSVVLARTKQKRVVLSGMLADPAMNRVMVFARTKHGADRVARDLDRDGFEAAVIHGNKSQNARQNALNGFRDGRVRILVATDIAARGIDVPGISHVVNFDLPDEAESYVHRVGRTGRNGANGTAITLVDPSENGKLRSVEKIIRMRLPVAADHLGKPDPQGQPREAANDRGEANERPQTRDARGPKQHHRPRDNRQRRPEDSHGAVRKQAQHGEQTTSPDQRAPQGERRPHGDGFGKKRFGGKPFVAKDGQAKPFAGKPGGKRFGGNKRKFGGGGGRGPARAA